MTEPKKGFTAVPNQLLEAIYSSNFTVTELKIILAVIRYTYGYNRQCSELSIQFIANATGVSRDFVAKCIRKLTAGKVLTVYKEDTRTTPKQLGINAVTDLWYNSAGVVCSDRAGVVQDVYSGVAQDEHSGVEKGVAQEYHQDINNKKINKENKKESVYAPEITQVIELFNSVCRAYTPVVRINSTTADRILFLLEHYPIDRIETGFTYAQRSQFLRNGKNGWRPNFEWMINPDNMSKILDGNYGGTQESDDPDYWQSFFEAAVRHSMGQKSG